AVGLEPSALTSQIFEVLKLLAKSLPFRLRPDSKAISVPSGDQTGVKLGAFGSLVKAGGLGPSAFTTQMLGGKVGASMPSSLGDELKATFFPSGDQKGARKPSPKVLMLVNAVRPLPSEFTTQTFSAKLVLAASLPSGLRLDSNVSMSAATVKT